ERTAPCYLALAHHEDDLAETVVQRLMRGTGLAGLAAMRPVNGVRIRPWLKVPQQVIREAAVEQGVSWREDSSNLDRKYERNWVRHELLPLMELRRPGTKRHLAALALEAAEFARTRPLQLLPLATVGGSRFFSLAALRAADSALLHKVFQLDRAHTQRLEKFFRSKNSGSYPAPGVLIRVSCGLVYVAPKGEPELPGARGEGRVWESLLGRWKLENDGSFSGAHARGRLKKLQVPLWFRNSVPCLERRRGEVEPLVPPRWFEPWQTAGWSFEPSELSRRIFAPLQRSTGRTPENSPEDGRRSR
ncbi:MAG: tRNA lysidine(34) synthetase TilS, partial [Bdellovibrionales bacterium]|nr:tRNA lysidine(34) synthetase TilS [Bdellovibrionales bacterium]